MAGERKSPEHVALAPLFIAFLRISLLGFGGGLVWARPITVEQRQLIDEAEFVDILSLCQFMPGPNVVGIAVCVGAKLRGLMGAIAAVAGFVLIPWTVGLSLGVFCLRHAHLAALQNIFSGEHKDVWGLMPPRLERPRPNCRDRRETGGQAAIAVGGDVSLAGWNFCPNSEPNVPL
jgi:chromate transporter